MDNLGAIGGPLLAASSSRLVGVRTAMLVSVIPGLLATAAIIYAIRVTRRATKQASASRSGPRPARAARTARAPLPRHRRLRDRQRRRHAPDPARHQLLTPGTRQHRATQIALWLYIAYNVAAAAASVPGGHLGDRRGNLRRRSPSAPSRSPPPTSASPSPARSIAVLAALLRRRRPRDRPSSKPPRTQPSRPTRPIDLRGSAFGRSPTIQSLGNFAASAVAGLSGHGRLTTRRVPLPRRLDDDCSRRLSPDSRNDATGNVAAAGGHARSHQGRTRPQNEVADGYTRHSILASLSEISGQDSNRGVPRNEGVRGSKSARAVSDSTDLLV